MSEHARPQVSHKTGPSIVWLIPIITLVIGGWLIARTALDQAPRANISLKTAEGIEAGKTRIKYKSVDIGLVEEIQFSEGFDHVILSISLNQGLENFLRRNTRFWVVRPQLSLRGVSGLSTLVSGSYIEIDPGPGAKQDHFIGLEQMPLITTDDAGSQITLVTDKLGSLGSRSPIYYRGLDAGEVLGYELGSDAKSIYIHAFIRDPYDKLIKGNSRFWNVSGLDVSLDANGIDLKTASLQALMFGGISFETPTTLERSDESIESLIFTLYPNHDVIDEQSYTRKQQFVMYFTSSVRGLNAGAPLEFKGIRIGTVLDIRLEFNSLDSSFKIPVLVEIEPDRIIDSASGSSANAMETLAKLIDSGLRANLATGSFLTGKLFVELNMHPNTPAVYMDEGRSAYPELPTVPGAFEAMTVSIQAFMSKLEAINVDKLGEEIVGILSGANSLLNTDESEQTVTDLQASFRALKNILRSVDEIGVEKTIESANSVLQNLDGTLETLDGVLNPNSPLQYNLIQVTGELEETARSIRALVETLERQPQSLIFGKPNAVEENRNEQ